MHADAQPSLRRFTLDEYHRMLQTGVVGEDEHLELVDGTLVMSPPHGGPHASVVERLDTVLHAAAAGHFTVRCQLPLSLRPSSEPEPDLALVALDAKRDPHPTTAAFVAEVSSSTLRYDTTVKVPLYARHAVPEVWIIDVDARAVVVHRAPIAAEGRYADVLIVGTVSPLALPHLAVDVDALFA